MKKNILYFIFVSLAYTCGDINKEKYIEIRYEKMLSEYQSVDSLGRIFLSKAGYSALPSDNGKKLDEVFVDFKDTLDYIFVHTTFVNRLSENSRSSDAITLLKRMSNLVKHKDKGAYYYNLALNYFDVSGTIEKDSALMYIERAISFEKSNAEYYFLKSRIQDARLNLSAAIEDINFAIKIMPSNIKYINQRGIYQVALGNYEAAIVDLENIYPDNDSFSTVHLYRALSYFGLDDYILAVKEIDHYFSFKGEDPLAYYIRGYSILSLKGDTFGLSDIRKSAQAGNESAVEFLHNYSLRKH